MTNDYIGYIRKQDAVNVVANTEKIVASFNYQYAIDALLALTPADVEKVCHCKDCIHNNDCDIQHSAQAGENFFCGFGETEKDVREDVYE